MLHLPQMPGHYDILKVKILSESCSDISSTDCQLSRGHLQVNGHQYSLSRRGINLVLFDYRSGIYEKRESYDIFEVPSTRTDLTAVLNSLPPGKILFMAACDAVVIDSNLAEALQKVGVSATFATSPAPAERMSLAYVGYTGPERKHWEKSVNKIGGTGASTLEVTINPFTDRSGYGDCSDELGLRTWKIPDSSFYAKSYWGNDANHRPLFGRLQNISAAGWCSFANTAVSEYLQVDLGRVKLVSGVAIQGHSTNPDNVATKFKVEFSEDGVNWQNYQDDPSSIKEFDGIGATGVQLGETRVNWIRNTKSRFIRVVPTARKSLVDNINCLRIELFGCSIPASSPSVNWSQGPNQYINKHYKGSISAFATIKNNLKVGISTADDNSTLAKNTQQIHFTKVNASITLGDGTRLKEIGKFSMVTDDLKMDTSAFTNIDVEEEDCYKFEADFAGKIVCKSSTTREHNNNTFIKLPASRIRIMSSSSDQDSSYSALQSESEEELDSNNGEVFTHYEPCQNEPLAPNTAADLGLTEEQNMEIGDDGLSSAILEVLDAKLPTGSRQFVVSLESNESTVLYVTDIHVQRQEPDQSSLQLNVTYEDTNTFVDKSYMNMNFSVSHLAGGSHSKAYRVIIMMYYNAQFLQLNSFDFLNTERFDLPPSVNETKPGSVMIQTDTLGLSNTQHFSIVFQVNNPNSIKRGENCAGNIIFDFTYENNLKTFNGAVNSTLNKLMPYKCEIDKTKDIRWQSARLPSPEFSIVYDEMNQHLVFCYQKKTYMTRNFAFCFSHDKSTSSWKSIPNISAVMAVDVEKRILYGVERLGKSYIISNYPYTVFNQIEDSEWAAVKDQPQLRRSKTANSVDLLPSHAGSFWTISASGQQIWMATNSGLHKHTDVGWKRVAGFA
eukprot:gene2307-17933_t